VSTRQPTDRELLERIHARDATAVEAFYDRYYDRVYRYALTRVQHVDTAADITQEVFLRAVRNLDRVDIEPHGSFFPWLKAIARNVVIDLYRDESRRGDAVLEADLGEHFAAFLDSVPSTLPSAQQILERQEIRTVVRRALQRLPDSQRQVMVYRFIGDMSPRQIAAATGQTVSAVKSLIHRGLVRMRRELADLMPEKRIKTHATTRTEQQQPTERNTVRIRR